jgi:arginase family enzyme
MGPGRRRRRPRCAGAILADGRIPLVLGGECSVTIAVVAAFGDTGVEPALVYMDGGMDLFTPATNPTGIIDGAEDGSTADALVGGLVGALSGGH